MLFNKTIGNCYNFWLKIKRFKKLFLFEGSKSILAEKAIDNRLN